MTTVLAFTLPVAVFFVTIAVKRYLPWRVCGVCAGISVTWLTLLGLHFGFDRGDPLIPAIFMGGSAVGAMYYLAARLPDRFRIFMLPFLLTALFLIAIVFQSVTQAHIIVLGILAVLWFAFSAIYLFRTRPTLAAGARRIIECCKNW